MIIIKNYLIGLFLLAISTHGFILYSKDKSFVIITASYNNKQWYKRNLASIVSQKYDHWRLVYINDCSTDGTGELVEHWIKEHAQEQKDRISFINNKERRGHLANQYDVIHTCNNDEIILIVDGDDWLAHDHVLHILNGVYQDPNVWLTYGQFWRFKQNYMGYCKRVPNYILQNNAIRTYQPWAFGHLRTFYAGLFKLIKYEDLLFEGSFFPIATDVATMLPMLEMAGEHIRFISDILYIYNDSNHLSFFNFYHSEDKQKAFEKLIRKKPCYRKLENPIFLNDKKEK